MFNKFEPLFELGLIFFLITAGGTQYIPFKFLNKITAEKGFVVQRFGKTLIHVRRAEGQHGERSQRDTRPKNLIGVDL